MGSATDWRGSIIQQTLAQVPSIDVATVVDAKVTLQSTDLLALLATPFVLLAAPGVGMMYQPLFATLEYNPVSVDYTLNGVTQFVIGPQSNPSSLNVLQTIVATLVDGSGGPGQVIAVSPPANVAVSQKASFNNQPLVITHDGSGELLNGDGTLTVTLYYISTNC